MSLEVSTFQYSSFDEYRGAVVEPVVVEDIDGDWFFDAFTVSTNSSVYTVVGRSYAMVNMGTRGLLSHRAR